MAKYQLCSRDEYGQVGIHFSSEDLQIIIKKGKAEVSSQNDNSLTSDEKNRNYEAYFVEMDNNEVYAGRDGHNQDIAYKIDGGNIEIFNPTESVVKIYIGNFEHKETYASDIKGRPITSLKNADLVGRTAWFVRKV